MQTLYLQPCRAPLVNLSSTIRRMEQGLDSDRSLIRALVEWARSSPSKVASDAGLAVTTITRPFYGKATTRISEPTREKLRLRWPDFPGWNTGNNNIRSEVASFGDRPFEEKFGSGGLPAIPVLGTAVAMTSFDPERDIELTELDAAEVLDHVRRPASLEGDTRAYAVTVVGASMYPRFRSGRRVIVSPRAPVSIGDDVIVQLRGNGQDQEADRVALVLIKELVRRTASYIELRQFNPDVTFKVEIARVAAIHKVVGEVY